MEKGDEIMSEEQKKPNKSILGDQLNLNSLFNTASQSDNNNNALMNIAGSLMQNPNTMNSLMKVASSMFSNDASTNQVNDSNKPKQDEPATVPVQNDKQLSLVTSQLETLVSELQQLKTQLNEFKEYNRTLIEYIVNKKKKSKKK